MKHLSIMLKPASSGCNLRCRYCFYADVAQQRQVPSYGRMSPAAMEALLEALEPQFAPGDTVQFAFQGGEPTLVGLPWFRAFTDRVGRWDPRVRVSYALQTNATLLDEQWCRFLADRQVLVGVSLDLLPQCHDEARVDPQGQGTYRRCLEALGMLERFGAEYNVLCTLTRQVARHPRRVWRTLEELDIRYVQFTPCLDALNAPGTSPYALTPQRFAGFYTGLYDLWLEELRRGRYRSVKLFDDVVNLMAYGVPTACGIQGRCQPQLVVEADGSVYPCDFYCLDEYRIGSILENPLEELLKNARQTQARHAQPLPALCNGCPYSTFCNGGCRRTRPAITATTCGYRAFLNHAAPTLTQIARQQLELRGGE